jgi:hypothetical protein
VLSPHLLFISIGSQLQPQRLLSTFEQVQHVIGPLLRQLEIHRRLSGSIRVAGYQQTFARIKFELLECDCQRLDSRNLVLCRLGGPLRRRGPFGTLRHHHGAVEMKQHVLHLEDVHVYLLEDELD